MFLKKIFWIPLFILFLMNSPLQGATIQINGAGASFPYPIYSKWFNEYEKKNPQVQLNYQVLGSSGGVRQLLKKTIDFGASDVALKKKDLHQAPWPIQHVPTVLGAVVVAYHLPQGKEGKNKGELKLDGPTLASLFLGQIQKWNHPALVKLNPQIQLPSSDILVIRRADGSGTTAIFSDYLNKVSQPWQKQMGVGKSLRWKVGVGARGNDGVTAMIKQTPGSIGYVELTYALNNGLTMASLKNQKGNYIQPTLESISASAKSPPPQGKNRFFSNHN